MEGRIHEDVVLFEVRLKFAGVLLLSTSDILDLLYYCRDPELAFLALRYFDLWSFFVHESAVQYDIGLTLQLCACLLAILSSDSLYSIVETKPLEYTTRRIHNKLTALSFLHQLPYAEPANEIIKYGGCDVHIPSVIRMLNNMREGLNVSSSRHL